MAKMRGFKLSDVIMDVIHIIEVEKDFVVEELIYTSDYVRVRINGKLYEVINNELLCNTRYD